MLSSELLLVPLLPRRDVAGKTVGRVLTVAIRGIERPGRGREMTGRADKARTVGPYYCWLEGRSIGAAPHIAIMSWSMPELLCEPPGVGLCVGMCVGVVGLCVGMGMGVQVLAH